MLGVPQVLEVLKFLPIGFFSVAAYFNQLERRVSGLWKAWFLFAELSVTRPHRIISSVDTHFWLETFITSAKLLHLRHTQLFRKKSQVLSMLRGR